MGCRVSKANQKYSKIAISKEEEWDYQQKPPKKAGLKEAEKQLERFVAEAIVFGNKADAVKKFLQNDKALEAFKNFLKTENGYIDMLNEFEKIALTADDHEDISVATRDLVNKYNFPKSFMTSITESESFHESEKALEDHAKNNLLDDMVTSLCSLADMNKLNRAVFNDLQANEADNLKLNIKIRNQYKLVQKDFLYMVAVDIMPKFLESNVYKEWREDEMESNYSFSQLIQEFRKREGLEYSYTDLNAELDSVHVDPNRSGKVHYIKRALSALDPVEVNNMAKSSFLTAFLGSVEGLPVSATIASACKSRPGFPLIYCNQVFTEMTGYTRKEILGHNCKFLQSADTEKESIIMLAEALKAAKPVRVEITNYRKNGESFRNLLAMKPLFDNNGKYIYVIGLQFDALNTNTASLEKLRMIAYLLSTLPDRLPFDDLNES